MNHLATKPFAALLILAIAGSAGCGGDPGTSVRIALVYDDALGLDRVDVNLNDRTESGPIAHELLLLVPDETAGVVMPMEVFARSGGELAAFGTTSVVPELDTTVAATVTLGACTQACAGDMLTTCSGPPVQCALGCSDDGDAHCIVPKPSNAVDPADAAPLRTAIAISDDTVFDADTGAISGGFVRAGVSGVDAGIGYVQSAGIGGGAPLGIFVFHSLTIEPTARVSFTGTRAVVLLVAETARIDGALDLTGGRGAQFTPGPGGGAGGDLGVSAGGCGPGGAGQKSMGTPPLKDGGGGGGGGKTAGAPGGTTTDTTMPNAPGGSGGAPCLSLDLEPLQGGSGGGNGSPGDQPVGAVGGGGGGGLQITALGSLEITGTINVGGAGGGGGVMDPANVGAGAGGGAGGAILLESPAVTIASSAFLAANGGGGGASGANIEPGAPGSTGSVSLTPAAGGPPMGTSTVGGGAGAAGTTAAVAGGANISNGGGGGGGVGTILIRARTLSNGGTFSPAPVATDVKL